MIYYLVLRMIDHKYSVLIRKSDQNVFTQAVPDQEHGLLESNDLFDLNWLEACSDLTYLLNQLSVTSRTVVLLHEVEGYNHKEISQFYQKSESFSKVTLSRAYAQLKMLALDKENNSAFK